MRMALTGLMLLLFWYMLYSNQVNIDMLAKASQQLTISAQLAAHDASLNILSTSVADGLPVFNQTVSNQTFEKTFDANAGFDPTTGQAIEGSLFQGSVSILYQKFIDYSDQTTYPFDYTNGQYGLNVVLNDPAVIFIVQVITRPYTANSTPQILTYPVVYQYKSSSS